jgi:hypothetical protein
MYSFKKALSHGLILCALALLPFGISELKASQAIPSDFKVEKAMSIGVGVDSGYGYPRGGSYYSYYYPPYYYYPYYQPAPYYYYNYYPWWP